MAKIEFTPSQKKAITEKGSDMLVAAGAGSGKTAVLVERVIRLLCDTENPVYADELLIVTFTKAAAAEMKEKIYRALSERLAENPQNSFLRKQLRLLRKALITTIHSFCLDVIKTNYTLLDIDPSFTVAEETETKLLINEALEKVLSDAYENDAMGEELYMLADMYGSGKDDSALAPLILSTYTFSQSTKDPEMWLENAENMFAGALEGDLKDTIWGKEIIKKLRFSLLSLKRLLNDALKTLSDKGILENYKTALTLDLAALDEVLKSSEKSYLDMVLSLSSLSFERLKPTKKEEKELSCPYKFLRDYVKKILQKLKDDYVLEDDTEIKEDLKKLRPVISCLVSLVKSFSQEFARRKKEKAILDFSDLEHYACKILCDGDCPSKAANEIKNKYKYILIDEYQDTSSVQEKIFSAIKNGNNLFMVGDIKQSIYAFRNANPALFLEKYKTFGAVEGTSLVRLFENFRSRKEILDFVNFIFMQIMSEDLGDLNYTEEEFLNAGIPEGERESIYKTELLLIDGKKEETDDENEAYFPEAAAVARRINRLIYTEKLLVTDKETGLKRPVTYKDIVILLRSEKSSAAAFLKELSKEQIPVLYKSENNFFNSFEIKTMLCLLRILDNPLQDIELVGTLRSPLFSFSEEEILEMRLKNKEIPLYTLCKAEAENSGPISEKCRYFVETIESLRLMASHKSVDGLISYILKDMSFESFVSGLTGGDMRLLNLRKLKEYAQSFEKSSFKGLFYFISYINNLIENNILSAADTTTGEENAVRIMSMHKSKGLEFPVVFVSYLGKKLNTDDMKGSVLLSESLGFGPDFVDIEKRISYPSFAKLAHRAKISTDMLSEEMRVLYVALTRAKEKLILTGSAPNLPSKVSAWGNMHEENRAPIPPVYLGSASTMLDFICPAIIRHADSDSLRDLSTEFNPSIISSSFNLDVSVLSSEDMQKENLPIYNEEFLSCPETSSPQENESEEKLIKNLSSVYPFKYAENIPVKLSVTEVKNMLRDEEYTEKIIPKIRTPRFLEEEKGLTPAEKGTAMHLVMQFINYEKTNSVDEIKEEIKRLYENYFITKAQMEAADAEKIYDFFKGPLGRRLKNAEKIFREQRFIIEENSENIIKDAPNEKILIQGIIDCFFTENGNVVLLDFKTDKAGSEKWLAQNYKTQIKYYEKAVENLIGKAPSESYIVSFDLQKEIKL